MLRKPTPEPVKKLVVPDALKAYGNGRKNPEFEAWHWQFCHF